MENSKIFLILMVQVLIQIHGAFSIGGCKIQEGESCDYKIFNPLKDKTASPKNCFQFFQCKFKILGDKWQIDSCPKDYPEFDHNTKQCVKTGFASCKKPCSTYTEKEADPCNRKDVCTYPGEKVAHPDNCQKFYRCDTNSWTQYDCPSGTIFDSVDRACKKTDDKTRCQKCAAPTLPTTTTEKPVETTTSPVPTTEKKIESSEQITEKPVETSSGAAAEKNVETTSAPATEKHVEATSSSDKQVETSTTVKNVETSTSKDSVISTKGVSSTTEVNEKSTSIDSQTTERTNSVETTKAVVTSQKVETTTTESDITEVTTSDDSSMTTENAADVQRRRDIIGGAICGSIIGFIIIVIIIVAIIYFVKKSKKNVPYQTFA